MDDNDRNARSRLINPNRTSTTVIAGAVILVAGLLAGCSASSDASSGDAASATTIALTVQPAATAAPTTAAPTTVAPTTAAPTTAPPTTAAPTTAAPTTTVAPTTAAPTTTAAPKPTAAPTTAKPSDPFLAAGYVAVKPVAQPIPAVGKSSGAGTRLVQQRLLDLGFWLTAVDGSYGLTTSQAVMAFQKYSLLNPTGRVDQATANALTNARYRVKAQSTKGSLVEVNKGLQVLFIIKNGQTVLALNTSTGSGKAYSEPNQKDPTKIESGTAITPNGHFKVNRERPVGWWEGDLGKIYRPKYFNGGIAVHGSGSIPNHPVSHGCVRVSVPAMDMIWASDLVPLHTQVWVHA